jgi:Septum formation initiator
MPRIQLAQLSMIFAVNTKAMLTILRKILLNRYLLALAAFGVWMAFFDKNDFFAQRHRAGELDELNEKIEYYKEQIQLTKKELQALDNDPAMLEKYAREKYYMKRPNEEVFVVPATGN